MFKLLSTVKKSVQVLKPNLVPINRVKILIPKSNFHSSFNLRQSNTEEILSISDEDMKAVTEGNEEIAQKLQVLILEAEVFRQEGKLVPSNSFMKPDFWKELLNNKSRMGRSKYLEYLFKLEKKKENRLITKEHRRKQLEERPPRPESEHLDYCLGRNNIFLRFYDTTINNLYNSHLVQAMQFGQKLIVDCGYEEDMTRRENVNCAKQIMLTFSENRMHDDPYDIHFCNLNMSGLLHHSIGKLIPTMHDEAFPMNVHSKDYLDLFPKDKLVYLTPHCREDLLEYDHDAVYIIGALVDKTNNDPLSLAKAKKQGLKMAKLPLDKYLLWGAGSGKSLTVNQMVTIMLDMKLHNNWERALKHVPKRKLMNEDDMDLMKSRQNYHANNYNNNYNYNNKTFRKRDSSKHESSWKPKDKKDKKKPLVDVKYILQD